MFIIGKVKQTALCHVKRFVSLLLLLVSFATQMFAEGINGFFVSPPGANIAVSNSSANPFVVNNKGELVSTMHENGRSSTIVFYNRSKNKLVCSFEMSVSSEIGYDKFGFAIGDGMFQYISGEKYKSGLFQYVSFRIDAGSKLSFTYYKDEAVSSGNDCGYVRNLVFSNLNSVELSDWAFCLSSTATTRSASVLAYYGNDTKVVVPASFDKGGESYVVNEISSMAFYDKEKISSITLPSTIISIGDYAFSYCGALSSIELPNSITSIGQYAFKGCSSLKSINIPTKLTALSDYLFEDCTNLISLELPANLKTIGLNTFTNCRSLESINIPSRVTTIDYFAFNGCKSLTSVVIPKSVTTIRDNVFAGCSGLASIVVESGNVNYHSGNNSNAIINKSSNVLISGCKNTVIPEGVTLIGSYAFLGCSQLQNINMPSSVKGIGYNAFERCESLQYIDLTNVQSIGSNAFSDCSSLNCVELSNELFVIGEYAFKGCKSMTNIDLPDSITIGKCVFEHCEKLESVTIPSYIGTLGDDMFAYCSNLRYVVFKGRVNNLSNFVFRHCPNLSLVVMCEESPNPIQNNKDFNAGYSYGQVTPFSNCTLLVPESSVAAYSAATGWRQFGNIVGFPSQSKNSIYLKDGLARPGGKVAMPLMLNSDEPVSSFAFKMKLPSGFSVADIVNPLVFDENRIDGSDMKVELNIVDEQIVDVCVSSVKDDILPIKDEKVAALLLDLIPQLNTGYYYVELFDTKMVLADGREHAFSKSLSEIRVEDCLLGDVNRDGVIDILDINAVVSLLVNNPQANLFKPAADINGDGIISIVDCTLLVNEIINKPTP